MNLKNLNKKLLRKNEFQPHFSHRSFYFLQEREIFLLLNPRSLYDLT